MTEISVLLWGLSLVGLGVVFGAVVGALSWRRGHAVGTGIGLAVVRAAARVLDARPSRVVTGAAVGGCDGLLLTGTLLTVALLIPPSRELIFSEPFRGESLRALGLLALAAIGLSVFAWLLLNAPANHLVEAVVGCGAIVAFCWYMAAQFKWQLPWAYGAGAGVLTLLLVYVVFPGRRPGAAPKPPKEAVLHFKLKPPPPDEHIQAREE
jgi:hypothetical protein